jgi:uncharacterized spore protein YtfJ
MANQFDNVVDLAARNQERAAEVMEKLFSVANSRTVFGEPVTQGDYTLITASEVSVGAGYGFGLGGGSGSGPAGEDDGASPGETSEGTGMGGGGGGGGGSMARPVAVISVGPSGVRVEPVVDPTKIALAFFTALGAMALTLRKMIQAAEE